MRQFFTPAIILMDKFRFAGKFGLISIIVILALTYQVYQLVQIENTQIRSLGHERQGLAYIKTIRQPVEHIQVHGELMNALLDGDSSVKERLEQKRAEISKHLDALLQLDKEWGSSLDTGNKVGFIVSQWAGISNNTTVLTLDNNNKLHSDLIAALLDLITHVANSSEITLDPRMDSLYLGEILTRRLPELSVSIGRTRARAAEAALTGMLDMNSRLRLHVLTNTMAAEYGEMHKGMELMTRENPDIGKALSKLFDNASAGLTAFETLIMEKLLKDDKMAVDGKTVLTAGSTSLDALYALFDGAVPVLDKLWEERIAGLERTRNFSLVIAALLLLTTSYLFTGLFLSVRNSVAAVSETTQQLARGDLTARLHLSTRDEMATIGTSFNDMAEQFEALVQQIISVSTQLSSAAEEVAAVSRDSASSVDRQRIETDQVATAMNEMAATVQEVSRSASAAAGAAANADNEAKSGGVVVNQATQAVSKLADEIDNAAHVIGNLEKDSDAIGSILDVIKAVAEQTNLLALNAAIEAARAGEQGRGFAVVADEVRTLASRTQKSTQEIEAMIARLQDGSRRAVHVMQTSREQAKSVVGQASEASDALQAITRAVTTINEMNTQIASAAEQQNATTEEMNKSISGIRDVAERTAAGASQSTAASEELAQLAAQLQSLINNFKIRNTA